jgi:hypothetical protein
MEHHKYDTFMCYTMWRIWCLLCNGFQSTLYITKTDVGHTIAQEVSRWLPIAAAWVRARLWSCGICGGQSGVGAGFLQVLRFPLPNFIPPTAPQSPSSIIWGLYNRPEVAALPRVLSPTPLIKDWCDGYGVCYATSSKIHVTSLRQMWALLVNGSNSVFPLQQRPNCWIPKQHYPTLSWRRKVTPRQGVFYPGRQHTITGQ